MKIKQVCVDNVLAIQTIDLRVPTPIAMIAGSNGTLKSSIYDSVCMAITREPMRAVLHKKDYEQLVHDGQKAGGGFVEMEDGGLFEFNLPKGDFKGPEVTDAMRVALNGQKFASMDVKQRTRLMMEVAGIRPSKATILPLLLEQAGSTTDAATILPLLALEDYAAITKLEPLLPASVLPKLYEITAQLRGGFEAAEKYAADRALESKRMWLSVTGKKAWGKNEAEGWTAPIPDIPEGDIEALRKQVLEQDTAIGAANQAIGAINQANAQANDDAEKREKLKTAAESVPRLKENLERTKAELQKQETLVTGLRERAKGVVRVGLIHDMAQHVASEAKDHMTKGRALAAAGLIAAYEKEHGALAAAGQVDEEAQASLPAQEKGLTVLQNAVANLQRDLDSASMAKGQYDALAPAEAAEDTTAELAEAKQLLETAKAEKVRLTNAVLDIEAAHKNRAEAAQKNVDAAKHHQDITEWLFIKDELSATGIPARLMQKALVPFNTMLAQAEADTGWPPVVIRDDMEIMAGGRLYSLQSESFRFRADAMIAQTVATKSGIKVLLLDRFDMLDMKGRAELFGWLDLLAEEGDIDSTMIFGTLKALPESGLPPSFTGYWVEDGKIAKTASYEAAAA